MVRLWMTLILGSFLPLSVGWADLIAVPAAIPDQTPSDVKPPEPASLQIPYGFSTLTLHHGPLLPVTLNHPPVHPPQEGFTLVATAEAVEPALTPAQFEAIFNVITQASRLDDLKPVLTDENFLALKAKVNEGVGEYVVIALLQAVRPWQIRLLDSSIVEHQAMAAVKGWSHFGPMQGMVYLVKKGDLWKIEREQWEATTAYPPLESLLSVRAKAAPARGLISQVSPDCALNGNFLGLRRVPFRKESRKFMFVFLMNDPSVGKSQKGEGADTSKRGRMHIVWTASKKFPKEQQYIEDTYPVDVSVARYDDGFAPGEWNLVLPRKKPRGADVSLLWSF